LGRKKVGKKLLSEVPVVLLAFDLIEHDSTDVRQLPLQERQSLLREVVSELSVNERVQEGLFNDGPEIEGDNRASIRIPPQVDRPPAGETWKNLEMKRDEAKKLRAEGLMLKKNDSAYQVGRPVGDWWKWKVDPYTIDAVLIYAQRGHGRRASLYTDYTFALWKDDELVPFAKAYSGLTDAEIRKVDAFVRKNTNDKFGPVRSVTPELVFELAFENIQKSTRHKSGIAVRFPRISRWRHDKKPADADRLKTILKMLDDE
ncbi:ATP-dependent DNA ligase, partial [bacterium]|nr:ATP-dependent DNA ligase [bacterium]